MASRYSIIQYVPNLIADERINIGVLVFDEQAVRVHFLQSWDRVRCFGKAEDIDLLKKFAHEMQEVTKEGLLFPGDCPSDLPAHERLVKASREWMNGVQFTEPFGSLASVDQLVEDIAQTYLLETPEKFKDEYKIKEVFNLLEPFLNFKNKNIISCLRSIPKRLPNKNKMNLRDNLEDSIRNYKMNSLEESFFPKFEASLIKETITKLSYLELNYLKYVELYLSQHNKIYEVKSKSLPRFYTFGYGFILALIVYQKLDTIWIWIINGVFFIIVLFENPLYKISNFSRVEFCLHMLKEAQLIQNEKKH